MRPQATRDRTSRTSKEHRKRVRLALIAGVCLGILPSAVHSAQTQPAPPGERTSKTAPAAERSPGGINLSPKFVAGRTTRYTLDIESSSRMRSGSGPDSVREQSTHDQLWLLLRVKESGETGSVVEIVYERVRSSLKTPDMDITADSAPAQSPAGGPNAAKPKGTAPNTGPKTGTPPNSSTPRSSSPSNKAPTSAPKPARPADPLDAIADLNPEDILQEQVRAAAGTVLTVKTDGAGNIVSVTGGDKLAGGELGGLGALSGTGAIGGATNPSAVANWVVGGVGAPPSARVGQSWTSSADLAGTPVGAFQLRTKYTLDSAPPRGVATISFRGQAEANSASGRVLPGFQLNSATYSGSAQWDPEAGELGGMTANTNVSMTGNVAGSSSEISSRQSVKVTRGK